MCRVAGLIKGHLNDCYFERIFTENMLVARRRLDLQRLQDALYRVAELKGLTEQAVHESLITSHTEAMEAEPVEPVDQKREKHRRHASRSSSRTKLSKKEKRGDDASMQPAPPAPEQVSFVPQPQPPLSGVVSVADFARHLYANSAKLPEPEAQPSPTPELEEEPARVPLSSSPWDGYVKGSSGIGEIDDPGRLFGMTPGKGSPKVAPSSPRAPMSTRGSPQQLAATRAPRAHALLPSSCPAMSMSRPSSRESDEDAGGHEGAQAEEVSPTPAEVVPTAPTLLKSRSLHLPSQPLKEEAALPPMEEAQHLSPRAMGNPNEADMETPEKASFVAPCSLPARKRPSCNPLSVLAVPPSAKIGLVCPKLNLDMAAKESPQPKGKGPCPIDQTFKVFAQGQEDMDCKAFVRLCKKCCLLDEKFQAHDARFVFSANVPIEKARMNLECLGKALVLLAAKRGLDDGLVRRMVSWYQASDGESITAQTWTEESKSLPMAPEPPMVPETARNMQDNPKRAGRSGSKSSLVRAGSLPCVGRLRPTMLEEGGCDAADRLVLPSSRRNAVVPNELQPLQAPTPAEPARPDASSPERRRSEARMVRSSSEAAFSVSMRGSGSVPPGLRRPGEAPKAMPRDATMGLPMNFQFQTQLIPGPGGMMPMIGVF